MITVLKTYASCHPPHGHALHDVLRRPARDVGANRSALRRAATEGAWQQIGFALGPARSPAKSISSCAVGGARGSVPRRAGLPPDVEASVRDSHLL